MLFNVGFKISRSHQRNIEILKALFKPLNYPPGHLGNKEWNRLPVMAYIRAPWIYKGPLEWALLPLNKNRLPDTIHLFGGRKHQQAWWLIKLPTLENLRKP